LVEIEEEGNAKWLTLGLSRIKLKNIKEIIK
jgi:hypothetical protein